MGTRQQAALGRRVKELRDERTLSQEDVAMLAGVSSKTVSNLERGETVRASTVRKVLAVFGEAGVAALRDSKLDALADGVAQDLATNGFDSRIERIMRGYVRDNRDRIRRWMEES